MRFLNHLIGRLLLATSLAWVLNVQAHATCIVLLTSPDFIVLGADGKGVIQNMLHKFQNPPTTTLQKVLLVKDRIAIAQCGVEGLQNDRGGMDYSFPSFISGLAASQPADLTVTQLVTLMENALPNMFGHFRRALALGKIKPEDIPGGSDTLFKTLVAGFENGHPIAYRIELPIDWRRLQLAAPVVIQQYPNTTKHIWATVCGGQHGINDLWNSIDNPLIDEQAQKHPAEYHALTEDRAISPQGMLLLDKSMLDVNVKAYPWGVGYPLTIFTIDATSAQRHDYMTP